MEDIWMIAGALGFFAVQIVCCFTKKTLIRLLPVMILGGLMALCAGAYAVSGGTNWAFLILLLLLLGPLAAAAAAWLLYGIIQLIKKAAK